MKHRYRLFVAIGVILVLALAFVVPDSRWAIRGVLRNEHFYRGKPTSYWKEVHSASHISTSPLSARWEKSWFTTVSS